MIRNFSLVVIAALVSITASVNADLVQWGSFSGIGTTDSGSDSFGLLADYNQGEDAMDAVDAGRLKRTSAVNNYPLGGTPTTSGVEVIADLNSNDAFLAPQIRGRASGVTEAPQVMHGSSGLTSPVMVDTTQFGCEF